MALVAAKMPQLKKRARRDWSKAKTTKFLGVLSRPRCTASAWRRGLAHLPDDDANWTVTTTGRTSGNINLDEKFTR